MNLLVRSLVLSVSAGVAAVSASAGDPVTWLSEARAAIGGPVATETVTSLRIRGSRRLYVGGGVDFSWEASWEAPDKFLQTETQTMPMGPMGTMSTTRRFGFNGDDEIAQTISDLPMPPMPQNKPNALVPKHKRALTQLLLPLLASHNPLAGVAPLTVVAADSSVPARPGLNLVAFAMPDGSQMHFWLDATTHLPSALSWMDFPIRTSSAMTTMTVTTTTRVPAGQVPARTMPPPMMPPPPSAAPGSQTGGPPVKVAWEMTLSDYRTDKGVTWPRRITVTMGTETWEELRISRYEVNPKINPRTFQVRK